MSRIPIEVGRRGRWALLALVAVSGLAAAADPVAGKVIAEAQCSRCHGADDWHGETADSLQALIGGMVAGKVRHKIPLQLSKEDVANIAAYWARGY